MRPRPVECSCAHNFTCRHCCRNAPPWFYTLSDGSAIAVPTGWSVETGLSPGASSDEVDR